MSESPSGQRVPVERFAVTVIVERNRQDNKPWTVDHWSIIGILPSTPADHFEKSVLREELTLAQYRWCGYEVELYSDDLESYYFNLQGNSPSLFVICEYADPEDETGEIVPLLVTLSYDEAASYMEADNPVFSLPIPTEMHAWVERYVIEHYRPEEKKKRKRQRWQQDAWVPGRRPLREYR